MDKRVIDEIRRLTGLPLSVTDEEIENSQSGTLIESRVNLWLSIHYFKYIVHREFKRLLK